MRALVSVSDKTGVVDFCRELQALGVDIVSTGGTCKVLQEAGIPVTEVADITGFPECLDGRVKTLHPMVHAGILARREVLAHRQQLEELGVTPIDLVVINLYPFKATIRKPQVTLEEAIENIDIGGPTMLRAAAKNHRDVTVVCDPADYDLVLQSLKEGGTSYGLRYKLALKVYETTAAYDAMISAYLRQQIQAELPENLTLTYEKVQDLRYGENPHQKAVYYKEIMPPAGSLVGAQQLHGKELSFNNINDANGALETLKEFQEPCVVAVKHANPCGVAVGATLKEAYVKAHDCDPVSIFGGIVACNRPVDQETALEMNKIFLEIILAPDFTPQALEILEKKSNLRLLKIPDISAPLPKESLDIKKVSGGLLVQNVDEGLFDVQNAPKPDQPATDVASGTGTPSACGSLVADGQLLVVTQKAPSSQELQDLEMAMKVVKHTKSNGIVFVKDGCTLAIGPGQTNRIWAVENGIRRCLSDMHGSVMASDAFFPFDDCVAAAAQAGITAIIQPGGSIRDQESIDKANELGIAMVFSGMRHFKH